jgi:hypothetical protein
VTHAVLINGGSHLQTNSLSHGMVSVVVVVVVWVLIGPAYRP